MVKKVKSDTVLSGEGSSVSAAVGIVAGSLVSQGLKAAKYENDFEKDNQYQSPEIQPLGHSLTPPPTPDFEVLGYETVMNADGTLTDVAYVIDEGKPTIVIDANRDGNADLLVSDLNQNGQVDVGEMVDVSEEQISMQPLLNTSLNSTSNIETDYIVSNATEADYENNANVDYFLA